MSSVQKLTNGSGSVSLQRARERVHRFRSGIMTVFGLHQRGLFVSYPYAAELPRTVPEYPAIAEIFAGKGQQIDCWLDRIAGHAREFAGFGARQTDPNWNQLMFPPRDGAAAYTIVRHVRPSRILEIGSGNSTRFMLRAVHDADLDCEVVCIDPAPRASMGSLDVIHHQRLLRMEDVELAMKLAANDILFIDSSHVLFQGIDVDIEFNRIFPALAPGVIVHLHDIFLPFSYPERWHFRFYNEQNALFGWIVSGFFDVLLPNFYSTRRHSSQWDKAAALFEPLEQSNSGSLWLVRRQAHPQA